MQHLREPISQPWAELAAWLSSKLLGCSPRIQAANSVQSFQEALLDAVIAAPLQLLECLLAEDGHGFKLLMPLLCQHQAAITKFVACCGDESETPAMVTIMTSLIKRATDEGRQHVDAITGAAAQALRSTDQETAEGAASTLLLVQCISETVWSGLQALSLQQPLYEAMCSSNSTVMEAAASATEMWWQYLEDSLEYVDEDEEAHLHVIAPMLQRAASDLQQHHSVGAAAYMYMARWTTAVQQHVPVLVAVLQAEQQQNSQQQEQLEQQQQNQQAICKVFALASLVRIASEAPALIAAQGMPSWLSRWLSEGTAEEVQDASNHHLGTGDAAAVAASGTQPAVAGPVDQAAVTAAVHPAVSGLLQTLLAALSCKSHLLLTAALSSVTDAALLTLLQPAMALMHQQGLQALQAVQLRDHSCVCLRLWGVLAAALPPQQLQALLCGLLQQMGGVEHAAAFRAAGMLHVLMPSYLWVRVPCPSQNLANALLHSDNMQLLIRLLQQDDADLSAVATEALVYSLTHATAGAAGKRIADCVGMCVALLQQGEAAAGMLVARLATEANGRALLQQQHVQVLVDTVLHACQQQPQQLQPLQQLFGCVGVCSLAVLCEIVQASKQLPDCDRQLPQWLRVWLLGSQAALEDAAHDASSLQTATSPSVVASPGLASLGTTADGPATTVGGSGASEGAATIAIQAAAGNNTAAGGCMHVPLAIMTGVAGALTKPEKHVLHQAASAAIRHALRVAPQELLAAVVEPDQLEYFVHWLDRDVLCFELIAEAAPQLLHRCAVGLAQLMLRSDGDTASKAAATVSKMAARYQSKHSRAPQWAVTLCEDAASMLQAGRRAEPAVADAALSLLAAVAAEPDVPGVQLTLGSVLMQQVQAVHGGSIEAADRLGKLVYCTSCLRVGILHHIAALLASMPPSQSTAATMNLLDRLACHLSVLSPTIPGQKLLLQFLIKSLQDESAETASKAAGMLKRVASSPDSKDALLAVPQCISELLQAALPGHLSAATTEEQRQCIKQRCLSALQAVDTLVRSDAAFLQAGLEHTSLLLAAMQQSWLPEVAAVAGQLLRTLTASLQAASALCEDRHVSALVDLLQWQQGAALQEAAHLVLSVACQPAGTPLLSTRKRFEMVLNASMRHADSSSRTAHATVASELLRALSHIVATVCSGAAAATRRPPQALIKGSHVRQLVEVAQQPVLAVYAVGVLAWLLNSDQYKLLLFPHREALHTAAQKVKDSNDAKLSRQGTVLLAKVASMNQAVTISCQMTHRNAQQAWRSYVEAAEHFAKLFSAYRTARRSYCSLGQHAQLPGSSVEQQLHNRRQQQAWQLSDTMPLAADPPVGVAGAGAAEQPLKRLRINRGGSEGAVTYAAANVAVQSQCGSAQDLSAEQQQRQQAQFVARLLAKQELDVQYGKAVAALQALVERCTVHDELHQQLQGAGCA